MSEQAILLQEIEDRCPTPPPEFFNFGPEHRFLLESKASSSSRDTTSSVFGPELLREDECSTQPAISNPSNLAYTHKLDQIATSVTSAETPENPASQLRQSISRLPTASSSSDTRLDTLPAHIKQWILRDQEKQAALAPAEKERKKAQFQQTQEVVETLPLAQSLRSAPLVHLGQAQTGSIIESETILRYEKVPNISSSGAVDKQPILPRSAKKRANLAALRRAGPPQKVQTLVPYTGRGAIGEFGPTLNSSPSSPANTIDNMSDELSSPRQSDLGDSLWAVSDIVESEFSIAIDGNS